MRSFVFEKKKGEVVREEKKQAAFNFFQNSRSNRQMQMFHQSEVPWSMISSFETPPKKEFALEVYTAVFKVLKLP